MSDSLGSPRDFADAGRLGHLLWEVSSRASSLTDAALADLPLTPASAGVLDAVAAQPGTSIAEMARWLPTSAQGISQIAARLQRLGYLERQLGPRGHGVALFVTEAGAAARAEADRRLQQAESRFERTLGPGAYRDLVRLLDRARVELERTVADDRPREPANGSSTRRDHAAHSDG